MHQSGGVGKTTETCLLSEGLAINYGLRVLVLDLDPQTDATSILVGNESADGYSAKQVTTHPYWNPDNPEESIECPRPSIRHLLVDDPEWPNATVLPYPTFIQHEDVEGRGLVDLIAGDKESLSRVNTKFHLCPNQVVDIIHNLLHSDDVWNEYDVVLIDTSPSGFNLWISSLSKRSTSSSL